MSKKIVINKEQIESLIKQYETSDNPFYRGKLSQLKGILAHGTEIDTDQSIEDRAKSILNSSFIIQDNGDVDTYPEEVLNALKQIATEQDLISKAREKEMQSEQLVCPKCLSNDTRDDVKDEKAKYCFSCKTWFSV